MALNKERIRLFVDELRSRRRRQGNGALARYNPAAKKVSYCCLGVACEVARAHGLKLDRVKTDEYYTYAPDNDSEASFLPYDVRDWFGFLDTNPEILILPEDLRDLPADVIPLRNYTNAYVKAVAVNDVLKLPFSVIANAFERTYLTEETSNAAE